MAAEGFMLDLSQPADALAGKLEHGDQFRRQNAESPSTAGLRGALGSTGVHSGVDEQL